jgi:MFS family permease
MTVSRGQTIVVVGYLILIQATGALAGFWLPAIAPEIGADLGVSPAWIGYQVLIQYVFGMLSSLMAGGFVSRFGSWRASQLALLVFVVAHLLFLTGSIATIALGSVALGCGYGLVTPAASHLLNKIVTPANRNLVFSIRFTGVPLGGIAAGLAAPAAALAIGWQHSVLVVIFVALVLALAMQPLRARWDDDRSRSARLIRNPVSDMKMVWNLAPLKWIALFGFCMSAVQTTLTTYTVTMLVEDLGYTLVAAGVGLSTVQFASVFGRVAWGWLADRVGSGLAVSGLVALIAAICAGVTCLLTPAWPTGGVYMLCFAFGLVGMGWNGVYASEIARLAPPGNVSAATGASMFITFSGVFLGPVVFVAMHDLTGVYTTTFAITAAIALIGLFCVNRAARALRGNDSSHNA